MFQSLLLPEAPKFSSGLLPRTMWRCPGGFLPGDLLPTNCIFLSFFRSLVGFPFRLSKSRLQVHPVTLRTGCRLHARRDRREVDGGLSADGCDSGASHVSTGASHAIQVDSGASRNPRFVWFASWTWVHKRVRFYSTLGAHVFSSCF